MGLRDLRSAHIRTTGIQFPSQAEELRHVPRTVHDVMCGADIRGFEVWNILAKN